jgi:hypothetical protein
MITQHTVVIFSVIGIPLIGTCFRGIGTVGIRGFFSPENLSGIFVNPLFLHLFHLWATLAPARVGRASGGASSEKTVIQCMTTRFREISREMGMRVNARFEGEAERQLNELAEMTGQGVSEVLRASVRHYHEQMRARRGGLVHFAAFVGRGHSGRADVAGSYKARLTESWGAKHQGHAQPAYEPAVHEPERPWPAPAVEPALETAPATPPRSGA